MPWGYASEQEIVKKWGDKYDIDIEVVQINDYVESINQYTAGAFDATAMTNMDALTIPAAGGIDSTALIVGDFSNGNDGLVELSVSHYLLARGLESVGMKESDIKVVNTSDADMVAVYGTDSVKAVATWNPLLSEIESMPDSNKVFDSSKIPGEIIDLLVINTETLKKNPNLGKALVGAWYEIMGLMSAKDKSGEEVRTWLGKASGTDLAGYEAQLASTEMFYKAEDAVKFTNSEELLATTKKVSEFSFDHGLLGDGAPDAGFIGIETPKGIFGNKDNVKLRFNPEFMQMAVDGKL